MTERPKAEDVAREIGDLLYIKGVANSQLRASDLLGTVLPRVLWQAETAALETAVEAGEAVMSVVCPIPSWVRVRAAIKALIEPEPKK